jgi:tetratricopeptide (TPR) repeat protein
VDTQDHPTGFNREQVERPAPRFSGPDETKPCGIRIKPRFHGRPMHRPIIVLVASLIVPVLFAQEVASVTPARPEVEALFQEGQEAYNRGTISRAIALFSEVITRDPGHLNAHLQRGFCHTMQREYQKAIDDFTSVIEEKNDHLWAYTSRGSAYAKLGRHDLAMRDFDRVLELNPRNEEAYNNRGWSKKALGDTKGACADWRSSKKMGNAEARIILETNKCK